MAAGFGHDAQACVLFQESANARPDDRMVIGQNPASNHPRMMGALDAAARRGATIIAINPLAERGFTNFVDPKDVVHSALGKGHAVAKAITA